MQIGKCKIELPFFACLAGILLIDHTRYMGYLLASIALHEGAHLLALQIWGISVRRIVLSGFRIQIDLVYLIRNSQIKISVIRYIH